MTGHHCRPSPYSVNILGACFRNSLLPAAHLRLTSVRKCRDAALSMPCEHLHHPGPVGPLKKAAIIYGAVPVTGEPLPRKHWWCRIPNLADIAMPQGAFLQETMGSGAPVETFQSHNKDIRRAICQVDVARPLRGRADGAEKAGPGTRCCVS